MKNIFKLSLFLLLLTTTFVFSQENGERKKIKISGKIQDKSTSLPLEYATITLSNSKNPKLVFGGITNDKGEFSFEAFPGMYAVKV